MGNRDLTNAFNQFKCDIRRYLRNNSGGTGNPGVGLGDPVTIEEIRDSSTGDTPVFYIQSSGLDTLAVYDPNDTTSPDNGSTIVVDGLGRRYRIISLLEFLQQIVLTFNIFQTA